MADSASIAGLGPLSKKVSRSAHICWYENASGRRSSVSQNLLLQGACLKLPLATDEDFPRLLRPMETNWR
jgi:hypothetical protein